MTIVLFKGGAAAQSIQNIISSIGTGGIQNILAGMGISGLQNIRSHIAEGKVFPQVIRGIITETNAAGVQSLRLIISEKDWIQRVQAATLAIGDVTPEFPSQDWNIYLDGRSIKGQVITCNMMYDEDTVHNTFEVTSISRELFFNANPKVLEGTARIEIHLGARVCKFLLESRTGNEVRFTLWGRSKSAQDDVPFSDTVDVQLEAPASARETAESFLVNNSLDWDITEVPDWTLPIGWEFDGDPIEGVQRIADAVGAVVRCQDDGSILVRPRFPVRPIDMPLSSPDVSYDRANNLIQINYQDERGKGYDAVEVFGHSPDEDMPDMEVEESSPVTSQDVHVRVYWPGDPPASVSQFVTDGLMTFLTSGFDTFTEEVIFRHGEGQASHFVYDLLSHDYIGFDAGPVTWQQYSKELTIGSDWAIANITYTSRYHRYLVSAHAVPVLLSVIEWAGTAGISVRVRMQGGSNYAPSIKDKDLTNETVAVERGVAWLDNNRYDKRRLRIRVPYSPDALDGNLAYVLNDVIRMTGNYHITTVNVIFTGPQIISELEVVQCQV